LLNRLCASWFANKKKEEKLHFNIKKPFVANDLNSAERNSSAPLQSSCKAQAGFAKTHRRGETNMTTNKNPGNFANDRARASEAGRKGGHNSGGNFANDPQKASEAGRKGGQASHGNKS